LFDKTTKDNIKKLGLTHLIVVSGTQVSLIFGFLELVLLELKLTRKWRWLVGIAGTVLLILVVGFQAPVLRSALSILFSTVALIFFGRRLDPFRALIYSGIILLWLNPFFIISYSFWLSVVATFGLLVSMQFSKNIQTLPEIEFLGSFKDIILATIGTFLYTLPLIVNLSGGFSPIAILSNMIVLPVVNLITVFDILGFIPLIGELFLLVSTVLQNAIITILKDLIPFASLIKSSDFGVLEMLLYWVCLTVLAMVILRVHKYK
jgi:competence protein ComEC